MIPEIRVPAHEPLVHLLRDGMVEGVHHGSAVVLAPDGRVLFAAGDIEAAFYPRSAAKPLQATAMARLGVDLSPAGFAVAAASHSGEEIHLAEVCRTLDGAGLATEDLRTPDDLPFDPVERDAWVASGRTASRVAHNCSGKHAAMLATCRLHGWSTKDYLDPGHPLQRAIAECVEDLTGQRIPKVAVDGCGAPLFAVSLRGLARAAGKIAASAPGTPEGLVAEGIRKHPELVAGTRRDVTALMRAVPGLIAKDGFEAVQVAALPDGTAIAIKIADGGDRARRPVLAATLALCGVDPDVLEPTPGLRVTGALAELDLAA
ncbi:L-asparaginase II [Amycolatopsis lurida]|uniref:Asparaginase n=1 Tax=Amycolatopsis lurida NRRL 2430 TaxID=1460371 RepID=A0A2P2FUZ4_AMYLU|nr:asparaginase [Amycolatopsis lurida]KFU80561.1 asparaginase [Amycolatopsis lurida NRRL 2430]SEE44298.1 L-asparaginase II [Amycolatopsis lurida]